MNIIGSAGKLIAASIRYAGSGFQNVSEADYHRRLAVCSRCDRFDNFHCIECGCNLNLKARMATEQCPLGLWGQGVALTETPPEAKLPTGGCGGCKKGDIADASVST